VIICGVGCCGFGSRFRLGEYAFVVLATFSIVMLRASALQKIQKTALFPACFKVRVQCMIQPQAGILDADTPVFYLMHSFENTSKWKNVYFINSKRRDARKSVKVAL